MRTGQNRSRVQSQAIRSNRRFRRALLGADTHSALKIIFHHCLFSGERREFVRCFALTNHAVAPDSLRSQVNSMLGVAEP
jgi:hypothetical protein